MTAGGNSYGNVSAVAAMVGGPSTWPGIGGFVDGLFGGALARTGGTLWTAGFATFASWENWQGGAGWEWLRSRFPSLEADLYVCIGVLAAGSSRRSRGNVVAQPVLIVDDIGTKIDRAKWERLFEQGCPRPTARVQTSPGNETWFWALAGDPTAPERFADLQLIRAWLVEQELTDEVMDTTRYVRLPGGWNSKPKYRGPNEDGVPPSVVLLEWRLETDGPVDIDGLGRVIVGGPSASGAGLGWRNAGAPAGVSGRALMSVTAMGGAGALVRSADLGKPDALMRLGQELGMELTQRGAGVVEALCPNIAAHTTRIDTGFAFLGDGLMHCNHASCQALSTVDFRQLMFEAYDTLQGTDGAAVAFMARETMRDLGGLDDAASVAAMAGQMASASAGRRAQAAAVLATGLDGLVERFVWINSAGLFFDTVARVWVLDGAFDTHPAVLEVIPVGKSGEKRARNQVLNHPELRVAEGLARVPGELGVLVNVADDTGALRRMANVWRPSEKAGVRLQRAPDEWLELLAHVIPDRGYREWFVKWLARLFQHPGSRNMTIPLLVGGQGIGKDAILTAIKILLGRHNIQSLTMNQIGGSFNQWMLSDLVILPELKLSADGKMYNQIKDWTANPEEWVQINEKYRQPYTVRVTFSLISMTNHLDALPGLETDDRRWQIYVSPARPAGRAFYDRTIDGSLTDDALAGLLDYLLDLDLTGFNAFTAAPGGAVDKKAMLADTLRGTAQWTFQALQEGGRFEGRNLLTIGEVEAALKAENGGRSHREGSETRPIRDGLKAAGWDNRGQVRGGQDRFRLWVSPSMLASPVLPLLTDNQLGDAYISEKEAHFRAFSAALFNSP